MSISDKEVDELPDVKYEPLGSLTKSTIELLDLELKDFLKHMGYGDSDTTNIKKSRFKLKDVEETKKLFYKRENNEWIPLTKNNGEFLNKQAIHKILGGVKNIEHILGIEDKYSKLKSKKAKILNDFPTTSEINKADDIKLQSMP